MKIKLSKESIRTLLNFYAEEIAGLRDLVKWQNETIDKLNAALAEEVAASAQMEYALRLLQEREDA